MPDIFVFQKSRLNESSKQIERLNQQLADETAKYQLQLADKDLNIKVAIEQRKQVCIYFVFTLNFFVVFFYFKFLCLFQFGILILHECFFIFYKNSSDTLLFHIYLRVC